MSYIITVTDACVACGECVDVCPSDVLVMFESRAVAENAEDCIGCLSCEETCPTEAITVK